jgi:cytochrome c-type biogenesis protein CcmF
MRPARWFFRKYESQPTSEVAIHRSPAEDLYVVLAGYDVQTQSATFEVVVNPLVNWIWLGFGIMAFGAGIALLPEGAFVFASVAAPSGAATTGVLLFFLLAGAGSVCAQRMEIAETASVIPTCGCAWGCAGVVPVDPERQARLDGEP